MKEMYLDSLLNSNNAFIPQYTKFYIVDFLNIFSDYREIIYKRNNINFHSVKHENKESDTLNFFEMFFTKYLQRMHINRNSEFIFILKKISNYDSVLNYVLQLYIDYKIRFIIIENEYNNEILDKNKDDFLCQYIFCTMFSKYKNCVLISNDKYRDKQNYIQLFQRNPILNLKVKTNQHENINHIKSTNSFLNLVLQDSTLNLMKEQICIRCTIPKNKLNLVV